MDTLVRDIFYNVDIYFYYFIEKLLYIAVICYTACYLSKTSPHGGVCAS